MRKLFFSFVLIIGLLCLIGCWDRREMNQLGIVSGLAIDQAEEKDKIKVTAQIIKLSEVSTAGGSGGSGGIGSGKPYINVTNTGDTFFEALRRFTLFVDRRLYLPHNEVLIFGDKLARSGVRGCIDMFIRDAEPRLTAWVLVAKGEAEEVLDVKTKLEKIPAMCIARLIDGHTATSEIMPADLNMFGQRLMSKTTAPVASLVQVEGTGEEKQARVVGTAVFKQDKLVGYLTLTETRGLLWVLNKVQSGIIVVPEPDGKEKVSLEILRAQCKITPGFKDDGTPYIMLHIKEDANLAEERGGDNLMNARDWKTLERYQADAIRQEIQAALKKAQGLNADIFGFGEQIHKKYPRAWEKIEPHWEQVFPELEVKIAVEANIYRSGLITRPAIRKAG
jgi:spore germination protein KC